MPLLPFADYRPDVSDYEGTTSQNINNIERDMRDFVPRMLPNMSQDELTLHMEMLLRAYDPCISCSVHMLNVEYID